MAVTYDHIPPNLIEWMVKQYLFFVATSALPSAPSALSGNPTSTDGKEDGWKKNEEWGYANVSPKDMQGFEVVNDRCVRYQDLTGSGVETIAHLRQPGNGKLTIMFIAFEGGPRIVRLYGKGKVFERATPEFEKVLPTGDPRIVPGCRAIIELEVHKVGTSCGFSIPFFDYVKERPVLNDWAKKRVKADLEFITSTATDVEESDEEAAFSRLIAARSTDGLRKEDMGFRAYWNYKNARSRDRLPGLQALAPANDVRGSAKVQTVNIGGDEVELFVKPDGTVEKVGEEDEKKVDESKEKVSAVWARRIGNVASDKALLEGVVINESGTYDGKTVMKLLRRERMRSVKSGLGKDEMVMGLCLIVLGLAMGVAVSGGLGKLGGIDL